MIDGEDHAAGGGPDFLEDVQTPDTVSNESDRAVPEGMQPPIDNEASTLWAGKDAGGTLGAGRDAGGTE